VETRTQVDLDAAVGFVVAHGDEVDRARLAYLRTGAAPEESLVATVEEGQFPGGGWPAQEDAPIASVDATCFRLAELDDLAALDRPAARQALDWLAGGQRPDGTWEEDESLADAAPPWATPGDPRARLYLTANAAFWLSVAGLAVVGAGAPDKPPRGAYALAADRAAAAIADSLAEDGSWPSFLVTGWLGAAVLHAQGWKGESERMREVLAGRMEELAPAGVAWLACALGRVGVPADAPVVVAARQRLAATQRSDGAWPSEDGDEFTVHTALAALRACLPR
jgi:hypothetical protein